MIDIIFPADKIKKGSRIVIWGADITGMCFCEQIMSLKHADIVSFIDNKIETGYRNIRTKKPEWLRTNDQSYDYILIGSVNLKSMNEITRILTEEYNISRDRIVDEGYIPFIKSSGIADVNSPYEITEMLRKSGDNNEISEKSIKYLIDTLNDQEVITAIRSLFSSNGSVKTRLTCAYILFSVNAGDGELLESTYKILKKCSMSNPIWSHYFMFNFLNYVVMKHPEFRYHNYYLDRRKIMSDISDLIYKNKKRKALVKEKRIAIASSAPLLGGDWHITKLVAGLANGLSRNGYDVAVFIESGVYSKEDFFIGTYFVKTDGLLGYERSNRKAFDEDIPVFYSEGNSMGEHANDYVDKIVDYNPESVVIFGADRTCATRILYDLFPIVFIPTITDGSIAYFHCMVCTSITPFLTINDKFPWISEKQELMECEPLLILPVCENVYKRENRGWKEEFIVVTVGNRLESELNNEFIDVICREIKNRETLKWVIIGISSFTYISEKYDELVKKKKIEFITYEKDLSALYKIVDVYLNPDRIGGGTSVAWAMLEGIPVITLDLALDGCNWVGRENAIHGDYNELVKELKRLQDDKEYYMNKSITMKEKAMKRSGETHVRGVIEIINKAVEIFNQQKKEGE